MSNRKNLYQHYLQIFSTRMNRFEMSCPDCKQGCNLESGSVSCFHCDNCGLVECVVTSPVLDED